MTAPSAIDRMLAERSVIVCVGTGGVGKTTLGAALGARAASVGRTAVVITVDPARRLADALGVRVGDEPTCVATRFGAGLWAMMLDPRATFEAMVRRHADSDDHAEQILANRFSTAFVDRLAGMRDYMALAQLEALTDDDRFDVVIVDTPPSDHALDLLDAPHRLARFLEHPLFRLLVSPPEGLARFTSAATRSLLQRSSSAAGADSIREAAEFLAGFRGMERQLLAAAGRIEATLRSEHCGFLLVTGCGDTDVSRARFLRDELGTRGVKVDAIVGSLLTPDPFVSTPPPAPGDSHAANQRLRLALDLHERAVDERARVNNLARAGEPIVHVERRPTPVADLDALFELGAALSLEH